MLLLLPHAVTVSSVCGSSRDETAAIVDAGAGAGASAGAGANVVDISADERRCIHIFNLNKSMVDH